jgi:hypothetical protein
MMANRKCSKLLYGPLYERSKSRCCWRGASSIVHARNANHTRAAKMFEARARDAEANSKIIKQLLLGDEKGNIADPVIEDCDQLTAS